MLVAQVSDIHARPDNENLDRLQRAVGWLKTMQPDILICTGDLVDGGWGQGYVSILSCLQKLGCPTFYLPGNSDHRDVMVQALGLQRQCDEKQRMHFAAPVGDVLLVGLDASVDGEPFGDARPHLPWLKHILASRESRRPFLFTHHHMFRSGITPMDDIGCVGADEVAAALMDCGTLPIGLSSGHVHRSMSGNAHGVPGFICGSICRENPLLLDDRLEPPVSGAISLMVFNVEPTAAAVAHHISL